MSFNVEPYNLPAVETFRSPGENTRVDYGVVSEVLGDKDGERLALYLPFELLQKPHEARTQVDYDEFIDTYMSAWRRLLFVHDVEANFIDGDVVEDKLRLREPKRVVKASQLIPQLLGYNILKPSDIERIYQESPDPLLRQNIEELFTRVESIEPEEALHITDRRQAWLDSRRVQADKNVRAKQIGRAIIYSASVIDLPHDNVSIEGVYAALHESALNNKPVDGLLALYQPWLEGMWKVQDPNIHAQLTRVYRRLHSLGVVSMAQLDEHGVRMPRMDGHFSDNLQYIEDDIDTLQVVIERIQSDEVLSESVYPVALIGGSRLKGYGDDGSDIDVSVFVKPGVSRQDDEAIQARIKDVFREYDPILFWLDEVDGRLYVHDFKDPDTHTADSLWTHVLFGSAWIGDKQAIETIRERLLTAYFNAHDVRRKYYLERMEQDVLQYRLLHHGYARQRPLRTVSDQDVFWDSGYRELATRLFMSNVCLPKK